MTVRYVSIEKVDHSGYQVVQMSFPEKQGLYVSKKIIGRESDRQAAEKAARLFAHTNRLYFVPENTSVITAMPLNDIQCTVLEIKPSGMVIAEDWFERELPLAEIANFYANMRGLPLILPSRL